MEPMSLVEAVLNNDQEADENASLHPPISHSSPIKGLDESITITVTRTPGRPLSKEPVEKRTGKPANFALMSNVKNGVKHTVTPKTRVVSREELVCSACERVFKYKAAFIRHEAQCGLPVALKVERNAIMEAKKAEKAAAEAEKRKALEKQVELRCPTCLKQFSDYASYKSHDFQACAAERATYTFVCGVCQARFKYKNHMRRHEDSHNNVRRYNCDVCTTAFLRPDHLKRHMMRMHGMVQMPIQAAPPPPPKTAHMECPLCSKVLSRRDHLLRHMRNVHHMNFDGTKKRNSLDNMIPAGGYMDMDNSQSPGEDDESENQSFSSHDGLRIDESYEEIKEECESPVSEGDSALNKDENCSSPDTEGRDCLANVFCQPQLHSNPEDVDESTMNHNAKAQHLVKKESVEDVDDVKSVVNFSGNGKKFCAGTSSRSLPQVTVKNHGQGGYRGRRELTMKSGHKNTSDGNQNVVPNGHVPREAGEDWISTLVNFSGNFSGW